MVDVLQEKRIGRVAVLTMNRPAQRNALDDELMEAFAAAVERASGDPAVGAIVILGSGAGFCAGGDIVNIRRKAAMEFDERVENMRRLQRGALLLAASPKPVVAGVHGAAMGAGLSIALGCDFRIVARNARLRTAFVGVGYSGDWGISWHLPRLVGPAKSRELLMLDTELGGAEAEALGLVTQLVDEEAVRPAALALAARLAEGPGVALGYIKRNLHLAETAQLAQHLDQEAFHQVRAGRSDDHHEAVAAFMEKRPPRFTGR